MQPGTDGSHLLLPGTPLPKSSSTSQDRAPLPKSRPGRPASGTSQGANTTLDRKAARRVPRT